MSESSVGSNARRIEAVTSAGAVEYVDERLSILSDVASELKCQPKDVLSRIEALQQELHAAERKAEDLMYGSSSDQVAQAVKAAEQLDGYKCVFAKLAGLSGKELRTSGMP